MKKLSLFFASLLFICTTQAQQSVNIDGQIWMTKNLNVDHYQNGDPIPEVTDPGKWKKLKTGAWCYYFNKSSNGPEYGKLYNWYAINDPRGLAPKGWHIPTYEEFKTLSTYVGGEGNALKEVGQGSGDGAGTNTSGFSALLAGARHYTGKFHNFGYYAYFWSSSEYDADFAYDLSLFLNDSSMGPYNHNDGKEYGFSVRCLKN